MGQCLFSFLVNIFIGTRILRNGNCYFHTSLSKCMASDNDNYRTKNIKHKTSRRRG